MISKYTVTCQKQEIAEAFNTPEEVKAFLKKTFGTIGNSKPNMIKPGCNLRFKSDSDPTNIAVVKHVTGDIKIRQFYTLHVDPVWKEIGGKVPNDQKFFILGSVPMTKPFRGDNYDVFHYQVPMVFYITKGKKNYTFRSTIGMVLPYYTDKLPKDTAFINALKTDFDKYYEYSQLRQLIYPFLHNTEPRGRLITI